jgi:hypothetical protein
MIKTHLWSVLDFHPGRLLLGQLNISDEYLHTIRVGYVINITCNPVSLLDLSQVHPAGFVANYNVAITSVDAKRHILYVSPCLAPADLETFAVKPLNPSLN